MESIRRLLGFPSSASRRFAAAPKKRPSSEGAEAKMNKGRVLVLGAGFGGLELCSLLSEACGDDVDVTLIDKSDAFIFGYAKLDMLFRGATLGDVRMPYRNFLKSGVRFVQQTVTAIDPDRRRVTTDGGTYEADFLIIALGADYDFDATPGLAEAGEFYSVAGVERLRDGLPAFSKGRAIMGLRRAYNARRRPANAP